MRRRLDVRAFLTRHSDSRVIEQLPTMPGLVALSAPEAEFKRRLLAAGFSGSYFTLLGLAASLTLDAGRHLPVDDGNQRNEAEWHGYHRGLQTALACLAMHETGFSPRQAALLVVDHTESLIRCRWPNDPAVRSSGDG